MRTMTSSHDNVTDPKLRAALILDDDLENSGMHGDDRQTCHGCQAWAADKHFNGQQHLMMEDAMWRKALREARR
jgi:hypothetical protein